jgi:hypothetical protein
MTLPGAVMPTAGEVMLEGAITPGVETTGTLPALDPVGPVPAPAPPSPVGSPVEIADASASPLSSAVAQPVKATKTRQARRVPNDLSDARAEHFMV